MRTLIKTLHCFPIKKNKILVVNFWGKGFGDHGKAILTALHERKRRYRVYWAVKEVKLDEFPKYVKPVKYLSLAYFYHLMTAKVWIDNSRKSDYIEKRKGQYYIQAWHGDPMLKKIEADAEDALASFYVRWAKHDSKIADLVIANSDFGVEFFKKSFWYQGEIWKVGSPRLDILKVRNCERRNRILSKLGIEEKTKILLYAPTFRNDHNLSCYAMDYEALRTQLENRFSGSWCVLVRLHPNMSQEEIDALQIKNSDYLLNVSNYSDMYELMLISDILVTDYSSTMFEAGCVKIPVFLYATDYELYLQDRGVYFDYEKLPFPRAKTFNELLATIELFDLEDYQEKVDVFCRELGMLEPGNASAEIAQRIIDVIEGKKI